MDVALSVSEQSSDGDAVKGKLITESGVSAMSAWKLVQRRCYDLLSHRYSLLIVLVALTCVFVGIVHFGEVSSTVCLCPNDMLYPRQGILRAI